MADYRTFEGERRLTFTIPEDTEAAIDYGLNNFDLDEVAVVFGPGSKLREQLTDMRNAAAVYSTGLLLGAHPVISSALTNPDSYFFDDKWGRLKSSADFIVPLADGDNAVPRARYIGELHRKIFGFDKDGKLRSARYPEVWTYAHLAIMSMVERKMRDFDNINYTDDYWDELYQEERVLYGCYGVTDSCLPKTHEENQTFFPELCRTELMRTNSIEDTLGMVEAGKIDCPPQAVEAWWGWPVEEPLAWLVRILASGGLGKEMRGILEANWNLADQAAYSGLKQVIKRSQRAVPTHLRLVPSVASAVQPPENRVQSFLCNLGEAIANLDFSKEVSVQVASEQPSNREKLSLVRPVAGIVINTIAQAAAKTFDKAA